MGSITDSYELPVCNSFKDKIRNDQLCYEVDINDYRSKSNDKKELDLELGIFFILDYNEDRQVALEQLSDIDMKNNILDKISGSNDDENTLMFLNTIGKVNT